MTLKLCLAFLKGNLPRRSIDQSQGMAVVDRRIVEPETVGVGDARATQSDRLMAVIVTVASTEPLRSQLPK
jgi:hypothetical protein